MKTLQYTTTIDAPREQVWDVMLGPETYLKWANVAWPGSGIEGDWSEGSRMRFSGDDGSGTMAVITESRPHERVFAEHVAALGPGGVEDTESDMAKEWIGTTEGYTFKERDGSTELVVEITTQPSWASMFDETWPTALQALKELAESS